MNFTRSFSLKKLLFGAIIVVDFLIMPSDNALAQTYKTGDAPLTANQVELLKQTYAEHPQSGLEGSDGASLLPRRADASVAYARNGSIEWQLKIRSQGDNNSCQSVAVAYAADILDRSLHLGEPNKRFHNWNYIWQMLRYSPLGSKSGCDKSCSDCEGFNVFDAAEIAKDGIAFEHEYLDPACGETRPSVIMDGHTRFQSRLIWAVPEKYPKEITPKLQEFASISWPRAKRSIKEYLSHGIPVLVSIFGGSDQNDEPRGFNQEYEKGQGTYSQRFGSDLDYFFRGWHAMTVVGYDDSREGGAFKIANSYLRPGTQEPWGDNGYLWITYASFQTVTRLAMAIELESNQLAPAPSPNAKSTNVLAGIFSKGIFDGQGQSVSPNASFRIRLAQKARNSTPVCLDANTEDWVRLKGHQVILYRCGRQDNQKWTIQFREQIENTKYYYIRSSGGYKKDWVLAVDDGRLVLEEENKELDREQLWTLLKPESEGRDLLAIVWAGAKEGFVLEGDEGRLANYSDEAAREPAVLNPYNNLFRQKWLFERVK